MYKQLGFIAKSFIQLKLILFSTKRTCDNTQTEARKRLTIRSIVRKLSCREEDSGAIYITLAEAIRNHKPFLWAISRRSLAQPNSELSFVPGFSISNQPYSGNVLNVRKFQIKEVFINHACVYNTVFKY